MSDLSKRATVYFDPEIYQALVNIAATTESSLSEIVDEAVRFLMQEDQADLEAIEDRVTEPSMSAGALESALNGYGKI